MKEFCLKVEHWSDTKIVKQHDRMLDLRYFMALSPSVRVSFCWLQKTYENVLLISCFFSISFYFSSSPFILT